MTVMQTLTYQRQPENWLYEIKQKGDSQTCYVMVQNAKVCTFFCSYRAFSSYLSLPLSRYFSIIIFQMI